MTIERADKQADLHEQLAVALFPSTALLGGKIEKPCGKRAWLVRDRGWMEDE